MKIGVFDSGVGGQSVANAIQKELPDLEISVVEDKANLPYGTKTPEELHKLVLPLLQGMRDDGCEVIVVACNTVTTNIIETLRGELTVPLIGMEPMVKPAAEQTKSGVIAICATPATLRSNRYQWLKNTYAKGVKVLEPDCSDWASLIESNEINRTHIQEQIESVCQAGADIIVLGCTHYHWIEEIVCGVANGRAEVLQPELPVIEQLKRVLVQQP
jgi:glutamate racemase